MKISISAPYIDKEEKQSVIDVLESGQLIQGQYVAEFETRFADYHGAKYGVAVNNGTSALMASLMAHDISVGDEVIIPAFSFFATASCILSVGAIPVFADIDAATFCMSVESVRELITDKTRAIMPVHLYGQAADMIEFEALCEEHGLVLLEDAAQAHGASINNQYVGTWGTASFSFYPSKNMTTSEGGMVLTNDEDINTRLKLVRNHGMNTQYLHETLGYNFRMTNLCAAIGLPQLSRLTDLNQKRIENASYFDEHLQFVKTPIRRPGYKHVFHQYTVRVPEHQDRDRVVEALKERGIDCRIYYPIPLYRQPIFQMMERYSGSYLPETEKAIKEIFSIPVHPMLSQHELEYIVENINQICSEDMAIQTSA